MYTGVNVILSRSQLISLRNLFVSLISVYTQGEADSGNLPFPALPAAHSNHAL